MITFEDIEAFCDKNSDRAVTKRPFLYKDHIVGTDSMVMILVPIDLMPVLPDDVVERNAHLDYVFKTDGASKNVKLSEFVDVLKRLPRIDEYVEGDEETILCANCNGDGSVEFEHYDIYGMRHTIYEDCPCCDGTGYSQLPSKVKSGRTLIDNKFYLEIDGKFYSACFIEKIVNSLLKSGVEETTLYQGENTLTFIGADNVKYLVMRHLTGSSNIKMNI